VALYDVSGKTALITGGARGIGLGLARALVGRGASVALVDLDGEEVARAADALGEGRAIGVTGDVTDVGSIEAAVAAAVQRFGRVDVVVANAGIAPTPASMRVMPAAEFERVIEVNLLGVYRTVRAGIEQVIAHQGQAVLVSSVYAFVNGIMASPYAVAKAGVEQMGRALRTELAVHGASATVAYFGFVDTKLLREAMDEREALEGADDETLPAFLRKRISGDQAGEAIALAIERRRPRVIAPRFWTAVSTGRGFLSPAMDYGIAHASRAQNLVREAESRASSDLFQRPS
jgi:NAD(P)-dependent dehydrogenase (short-subunit alcohol dehydrogenase family)